MEGKQIIDLALKELRAAGADEAQASISFSEKSELNVDAGAMSLFRTTKNAQLALVAYSGKRRGSVSLNTIAGAAIREAAAEAVSLAATAPVDEANAISPAGIGGSFAYGDAEPDREAMYDKLKDFLDYAAKNHRKTRLEQCILDFTRARTFLGNTNGVALDSATSVYSFQAMFTSKEGEKTSSYNGSSSSRRRLEGDFKDWGGIAELMRQSEEQLETRQLEGKFVGDVIVTPHCLGDFIGAADQVCLGDFCHVSGTSPWKEALGKEVASPLLSLRSMPVSKEIAEGWFFTDDGFIAENCAMIEGGVLKSFDLSLYGSRKTGKLRCPSGGGAWVVDPGKESFAELLKSVKRGLLLCRFSGGDPNDSGDFAGVAKNSYYIEDGKIAYPVNETMISSNVCTMLKDISAVSRERIDFGSVIFPWVKVGGITISGK